MAKIMAKVNAICQSKRLPNAHMTAINPIVSTTVSQYRPTCDGLCRTRANSPSTASITPFTINKEQATIVCPSKINQAQKRESIKWKFVTCMTDTRFSLRYCAITRAIGLPHSDKSMTFRSPYFLIPTDTPNSTLKHFTNRR